MTVTVLDPSTTEAPPAPPPMARHMVPKNPDGSLQDRALCGVLWDRVLHPNGGDMGPGPTCTPCVEEFKRRHA